MPQNSNHPLIGVDPVVGDDAVDSMHDGALVLELLRLREAIRVVFRPVLRQRGLTDQNWRLIRTLAERGPTEMTTLATQTAIPMASASRIITRMAAAGLVRRMRHRLDGRQVLVELTPKGRRLQAELAPLMREAYAALDARLPAGMLADLHGALVRTNRAVDAYGLPVAPSDD